MGLGDPQWWRRRRRGAVRLAAINAQDSAEVGNHHVLGHVQAQNSPEDSQPEQPDVQRDARHEAAAWWPH